MSNLTETKNTKSRIDSGGQNERMVSFSCEDVIALAQAVAEPENHCAYDSYIDRYSCIYCDNDHIEAHKVKHALDCPVLIAIDLLT